MSEPKYKRMSPKLAEYIDLILAEASMTLGTIGYYDEETDETVMRHEFPEVYGWDVHEVIHYIQRKLKLPEWAA